MPPFPVYWPTQSKGDAKFPPRRFTFRIDYPLQGKACSEEPAMIDGIIFDLYLERKNATIDEMMSDPILDNESRQ
jgi:hypothetical protein